MPAEDRCAPPATQPPGRPRRRAPSRRAIGALAGIALLAGLSSCGGSVSRADAYEALSDTMMSRAAYPAAVDALTRSTKLDGNEPRRWLKLGRAWRALDNPALSAVAFQHALDLDPASIEALENLSVLLVRAGRFTEAKTYITPLLVLAPNDPNGLLGAGAIAYYERRYGDADRIASQVIQLAPDRSEGYLMRARVMEARGAGGPATALLEQRLKLDPDNADLASQLLDMYRRQGDLQGIRRTAIVLARLKPGEISYQLEAARAHHAAGREEQARAILAALLARYPGSAGINDAIAQYWAATLPVDEAAGRIAEMGMRVHGRARVVLADRLIGLGRPAAAVDLMAPDAAGAISTGSIDAHAAYARALLAAGRIDAAAAAAQAVLDFDGNDVATLVKATVALKRGRWDEALIGAQQVQENDRDNAEAALLTVQAYEGKGNLVLARQSFGDALAAMPQNVDVMIAYAEWLNAHGSPDDAVSIASQYARAHEKNVRARAYAADLCRRLKTATCLAGRAGGRKAWSL